MARQFPRGLKRRWDSLVSNLSHQAGVQGELGLRRKAFIILRRNTSYLSMVGMKRLKTRNQDLMDLLSFIIGL